MSKQIRTLKPDLLTRYVYLLLGCTIFLSACWSVKPTVNRTGKKLYEDFFVGEEGTQYFIKPLTFEGAGDAYLELDMTFRYKDQLRDSAILNISFFHPSIFKTIDSLDLVASDQRLTFNKLDFMFVERQKDLYKCRYTTNVALVELTDAFLASEWEWTLYLQGKAYQYQSPKRTRNALEALNYALFEVLRAGS